MKNLARQYVWWLKMDAALEEQLKQCVVCQSSRKMLKGSIISLGMTQQTSSRLYISYVEPLWSKYCW